MQDSQYCYPASEVLINKLNIKYEKDLFNAEKELTAIRLRELHPFREGNGRAQREFARIVCLKCGYEFSLACTTHREMLEASKLSFDKADSTLFIKIFSQAITPLEHNSSNNMTELNILTSDDLTVNTNSGYDYYGYGEYVNLEGYNEKYRLKIVKMESESGADS